jgi:hypothetical protein
MQAQDYPAAKWALGLRVPAALGERQVEAALSRGQIVRTHLLRPTWHFAAASDVDWMIELTSARVHRRMATAHRNLQLDSAIRVRAAEVIEHALRDGDHLTRAELGVHLQRAGLPSRGIALALLSIYAELERVMCSGPFRGKELTYALFASRVPPGRRLVGDDAIAELARRYFQSHGPATIRDFVWWSTLTTRDASRGLEANRATRRVIDGITYWTIGSAPVGVGRRRSTVQLLPIYDEYLVAYRDRVAVPLGRSPGGATRFDPVLAIDGQIAGTWKTVRRDRALDVQVAPARRISASERRAIEDVVDRYGRFLDLPATLSVR